MGKTFKFWERQEKRNGSRRVKRQLKAWRVSQARDREFKRELQHA